MKEAAKAEDRPRKTHGSPRIAPSRGIVHTDNESPKPTYLPGDTERARSSRGQHVVEHHEEREGDGGASSPPLPRRSCRRGEARPECRTLRAWGSIGHAKTEHEVIIRHRPRRQQQEGEEPREGEVRAVADNRVKPVQQQPWPAWPGVPSWPPLPGVATIRLCPWPPLRLARHSAAARSARSFIERNRSVLSPKGASQSGRLPCDGTHA